MYEIINFYKKKKIESLINYQMKYNIENNNFDLSLIQQNIKNKLNIQTKEINQLITILKSNENNKINHENKENETNNFSNFKFENINLITIIKCNQGWIRCLKTLDDGRLAVGDSNSNLIIYNKETFNPDIIIKNNLSHLLMFEIRLFYLFDYFLYFLFHLVNK